MALFLICLGAIIAYLVYRALQKRSRHRRFLAMPLSQDDWAIIHDQVPLLKRLPADLNDRFAGKVNLFLDQVDFYGGQDLEVTKEMELSIAAQACLLIANSDAWYDTLRTVIVYPSAFKSRNASYDGAILREGTDVRLGESWARGPVVLSWTHAQQGGINEFDGQNVVLHEFAHQLDGLSGATNAVPLLRKGQSFAEWERVFLGAYDIHVGNVERGRKTVMDAYGAENHQEFFAVAIEVFFEKPEKLQDEFPDVYTQLSKLLSLDPVNWDR